MIRTLVADDEPLARARVCRLLARDPGIAVVAEAGDGLSVRAIVEHDLVDLAILDIEMPELDGLAVSADLVGRGIAVMFVTAHEHYARSAFDADAADYVVKPVCAERLAEGLARVRRRIAARGGPPLRFSARVGHRTRFLDAGEIDWVEAQGNYAALHAGARSELVRATIQSLQLELEPYRFVRIHRGILVRADRIAELARRPTGEYDVRLVSGVQLVSGRTYRARLAALCRTR